MLEKIKELKIYYHGIAIDVENINNLCHIYNIIVENLKLYFKKYGIHKKIGADNGSKFVNKKVKDLFDKNNITFVNGKPTTLIHRE